MTDETSPRHGAAAPADFDVPGPGVIDDPYPFYEALHREAPLYRPPGHAFYILSRHADIKRVMSDTKTFSNDWYQTLTAPHPEVAAILAQGCPRKDVLPTADPPEHRRYRKLVEKVFTFKRVQEMKPYIQDLINEAIDAFIDDGEVEFMKAFAVRLPISIIADLLAVPRADVDDFKRWSDAALVPMSRTASLDVRKAAAYQKLEMQRYVLNMLEDRRRNPRDDFPSALALAEFEDEVGADGKPRRLDEVEFIQIIESFIVAGNETTTNALGSGMLRLVRQSELVTELREAPDLLPAFSEEILRLDAPIQGMPRVVTEDTEIDGIALPKGTLLDLRFGAANRDAAQFPEPQCLRLDRRNSATHLSFGSGIHFCVGSALVRQELPMAFGSLVRRLDNIRLAPGFEPPAYVPNFMVRGLTELHLAFNKRSDC